MNQKELREIRRRIRPEHNSITHLYGCYVNGSGEIISTLNESLGLLTAEEQEKYFALLKKSLSGALGKNLLDIAFATKQVLDSDEHRLLSALRKSEGQDPALLDQFYHTIIDHLDVDGGNYLILLAFDTYDVPHYGKDGSIGDAGAVYKYMLCAVCPVEGGKSELGYTPEDKRFHSATAGQVVSAPELGFLFPAFDNRTTNIYNALFYSRKPDEMHYEFIEGIFHTDLAMTPAEQREAFESILSDSVDCSMDIIRSVHEQLSAKVAEHAESKDEEPLTVSCGDISSILADCGVNEEQLSAFQKSFTERFGKVLLNPENIVDTRHFEVKAGDVTITVTPEQSFLIETREVNGRKYIMIPADGGAELNGFAVKV